LDVAAFEQEKMGSGLEIQHEPHAQAGYRGGAGAVAPPEPGRTEGALPADMEAWSPAG